MMNLNPVHAGQNTAVSNMPRFSGRRVGTGEGRRIVSEPPMDSKDLLATVQALSSRDTWVGGGNGISVTLRQPVNNIKTVSYSKGKYREALTLTNTDDQPITRNRWFNRLHIPLVFKKPEVKANLNQAFERLAFLLNDFTRHFPMLKGLKAEEAAKAAAEKPAEAKAVEAAPAAEEAKTPAPAVPEQQA